MSELRRLEELLAAQATEGLTAKEVMELRRLLATEPEWEAEDFELAAAALDLAMTKFEEPMPDSVRKIVSQRIRSELLQPQDAPDISELRRRPRDRSPAAAALPWLAAAAALAVALVGWWPRLSPTPEAAPETTVAEQQVPLAEQPGTLSQDWTATEDAAARGASGGVVWNNSEQRGFMRIRGLAANEPTREQYQLWIFDRDRDERYPIDGGVFDIPAGSDEVLVSINAKLLVEEPYLFAITVEPPGGVVVSSRERIVLVAEV